jgi:3-dehydroquinate dehydratase/shikimate dehydrogenase
VTIIAVPIAVHDAADLGEAIDAANAAVTGGADLIEWRLDAMADAPSSLMATLIRDIDVGSLLTLRSTAEGGGFGGSDDELAEWIGRVAALECPPIWVDVEYARWSRSEAVRSASSHLGGIKLLLSFHDFAGRPTNLLRVAGDMQESTCDAVKLAWRARSVRDAVECRDLLANRSKPMIALCMGPHGVMSRVLAGAWGGLMTFAAADDGSATAPGQPTIERIQSWYGFRRLNASTAIYGLIGDPLGDSPGYELHNRAFEAKQFNGVYLPLPTAAGWESLKATLSTLIDSPGLNVRGASITLPHKSDLIRFVRERSGDVSDIALRCGAANTLVVDDQGVRAENTDVVGIIEPLIQRGVRLDGGRAAVLGAGGVARAAVAILLQRGSSVDIFNRSSEHAEQLVDDLGELGTVSVSATPGAYDTVVQATSVGMSHGSSPEGDILMSLGLDAAAIFSEHTVALETIYDPIETPFVQSARESGCEVATGYDMWLAQAAAQQRVWIG